MPVLTSALGARVVVPAIGALAGVAVTINGTSPTGQTVIDAVWSIGLLAFVVWFGVVASATVRLAAITLAVVWAQPWAGLVAGAAIVGYGVWSETIRAADLADDSLAIERAVLIGAAFVTLSSAGDRGAFGLTTLVGIACGAALVIGGIVGGRRLGPTTRRVAFVPAVIAALGTVGLVVAGWSARDELRAGNQSARAGLTLLGDGRLDAAAEAFATAGDELAAADRALRRPWAWPARLVPGVAQHHRAAASLAGPAARTARTVADEMDSVDLDRLSIVDGRIDVDAVAALEPAMRRLNGRVGELAEAVERSRSPWLIGPVDDRIDRLSDDVRRQQRAGLVAVDALDVAPALLGAEDLRRYFVMFTTPAEARGQGGFMGNFATVTIDDGRIDLETFGRTDDLNLAGDRPRTLDGPADWLDRYGPYGYRTGPGGTVGSEPWSNITMSPHFPSTADVVAQLYPQSGGAPIDGVFSVDVFALEQLVGAVGPIDVGPDAPVLDGTNLASYLLVGQYEAARTERLDQLDTIAAATLDVLLGGADPIEIGRAMAPSVGQGRVLAWSHEPDEQALFERVGAAGRLFGSTDETDVGAALSLRIVNGSASKIDTFLQRSVCVRRGRDGDVGAATVTLTNGSPPDGLPEYVIGNAVGLPIGTSRLLVTWHSTVPVATISVDGTARPLIAQQEQDAWAYTVLVDIPAGASASIEIEFDGTLGPSIHVDPQPLVEPERWAVAGDDGSCDGTRQAITSPTQL